MMTTAPEASDVVSFDSKFTVIVGSPREALLGS